MSRAYRTHLEVLYDFLDACRRAPRKTRIIGLANLNPRYFGIYAQFCLEHRLIEWTGTGYRGTERTIPAMNAIRRVIAQSAELDEAIRALQVMVPGALPGSAPVPARETLLAPASVGVASARERSRYGATPELAP
jgi:predicted transcriptional regulator